MSKFSAGQIMPITNQDDNGSCFIEGAAKLKKLIIENDDSEYWTVTFLTDQFTCERWISTDSK